MLAKNKKYKCLVCGIDLSLWGDDRRGKCPECIKKLRSTKIKCAGGCKQSYEMKFMDVVSVFFEPGKKGGRKFTVYYCSKCLRIAKSRVRMASEAQKEAIVKTEDRLKRGSK